MATSFVINLGRSENPIEYPGTTTVLELECNMVNLFRFGPAFTQRLRTVDNISLPPPSKKAILHFADTFAVNIGLNSARDYKIRPGCGASPNLPQFLSLTSDAVSHALKQHPHLTPNQLQQVQDGINSLLGPCGYDLTVQFPTEGR